MNSPVRLTRIGKRKRKGKKKRGRSKEAWDNSLCKICEEKSNNLWLEAKFRVQNSKELNKLKDDKYRNWCQNFISLYLSEVISSFLTLHG